MNVKINTHGNPNRGGHGSTGTGVTERGTCNTPNVG